MSANVGADGRAGVVRFVSFFVAIAVRLALLWLPFTLAALWAIFASLWFVLTGGAGYSRHLMGGLDRLAARACGRSGLLTVSAELGWVRSRGLVARLLDWIEPGHCDRALKDDAELVRRTAEVMRVA